MPSYEEFCEKITEALSKSGRIDTSFAAQIAEFVGNTNGEEGAAANVVLSVVRYEQFETSALDRYFDACRCACTNLLSARDVPVRSWQKSAASVVLATTFALDGRYCESYSLCTNALSTHLSEPISVQDGKLWQAISKRHFVEGQSVANALNFYAALSLRMYDSSQKWTSYTNDLPATAMRKLQMLDQ